MTWNTSNVGIPKKLAAAPFVQRVSPFSIRSALGEAIVKTYPVRLHATPVHFSGRTPLPLAIVRSPSLAADPLENNVLIRYFDGIAKAQAQLDAHRSVPRPLFEPDRRLPEPSQALMHLFAPAQMHWQNLGDYRGSSLTLLNLMSDPTTQTTKTFASLVMVSRAITHIQQTGESIVILVTTSGNKGIALRSAVERALTLKLVEPQQLRIVTLVPDASVDKLRHSWLYDDPTLRRLNPIIRYAGTNSTYLKQLGQKLQEQFFETFFRERHTRIWYSLNLDNYQVPDTARAFFEYEHRLEGDARDMGLPCLHAHAVSSGFGFLGYHLGRSVLVGEGLTTWADNPGYFLIQHLHTPDMVLHSYTGSFDHRNLPAYTLDPATGLYIQDQHAHFPLSTWQVDDTLDATFYSTTPATALRISDMIHQFGGGGIVVSLHECLAVYALVRSILGRANIALAADPRLVTEWSTIMALTGVLLAIDRGIISERTDIVIHGTGYYARHLDYLPICPESLPRIDDTTSMETLYGFLHG